MDVWDHQPFSSTMASISALRERERGGGGVGD